MKQQATNNTIPNSKGASIFKKIIEDKKAIHEHMKNAKIYVLQVNYFSRLFFTNHSLKVPKFFINSD